jgi:hypothetical protein
MSHDASTRLAAASLVSLLGAMPMLAAPVDPATIPESAYVTVSPEGHLQSGGQRMRFWAVIGSFPNVPKAEEGETPAQFAARIALGRRSNELLVQRFVDLGFNMSRFWRNSERDYTPGDGSAEDVKDHFLALLKARGFRIWYPGIAQVYPVAADVDVLDDPATAAGWAAAMAQMEDNKDNLGRVVAKWDERTEAVMVRGMQRRTGHFNRHTGLRVGDDPLYAVFELTNEDWWMSKMVGGQFRKLPPFFQASLQKRWIAFLVDKYATDEALRACWGFLLPGESLTQGTVGILPLRGPQSLDAAGMDPQAKAQLEAAADADARWTRDDFNRHRGADVLEFFVSLHVAHKKRLEAALESMGRACRLAPTALDTGIGYEIQSAWLHQNADVTVHDAYVNGTPRNNDPKYNPRFPWMSGLEEYPRICHDVPWLEHNKVQGKPFLCYETQIQQPAKYRAEFPWRILALASIQDWDAICWHYWGGVPDIATAERPFDKPMDYTTGRHPQGYHFTYDEVQASAMRAAGLAFRAGTYKPAPAPTTFIYGRRSLYDPASMDYAGSYGKGGMNMLPTTYRHGVRLWIDPARETDKVVGPMVRYDAESKPTLINPTDEILFDTRRGGLTFDAPGGAAFTGFMSRFGDTLRFPNAGVELRDVVVSVPDDMPYPEDVAEDRYIAFGLIAEDGQPLAETRAATLSLVSTSFNHGFVHTLDAGGATLHDGKAKAGGWPVLTARVAGTVVAPALAGMRYRFLDWHMNELAAGTVGADGSLRIPNTMPVWHVALARK